MVTTRGFLRSLTVATKTQDKEKSSATEPPEKERKGDREKSGEKERSRSRPKTRSTTPKQRRPGDTQDEKKRPKTPSTTTATTNPSNPARNGYDTDERTAARIRAQVEVKTPAQAALQELLEAPKRRGNNFTRELKGAMSDEKSIRRKNASNDMPGAKATPELLVDGGAAAELPYRRLRSYQSQHPEGPPLTPKATRVTTKTLPLFSIDRLREGLSVPLRAQPSHEEASEPEPLSQCSSDVDGMLKRLGDEVSLRAEAADLRRQLQESEQARVDSDSAKEAALALAAEAELAREAAESARLKAEAALAEAEEFRQAAELALEEAMQSFQEREGMLQEAVNCTIQKMESLVLEKAELEERLTERELQLQKLGEEMEAVRKKADAASGGVAEALELLASLEKKVKEDAEVASKRLGEFRRKATIAGFRSKRLEGRRGVEETSAAFENLPSVAGSEGSGEGVAKSQAIQQEIPSTSLRDFTGSLRGKLKWNSRRLEASSSRVDQEDDDTSPGTPMTRRLRFHAADEGVKELKLQAERIDLLLKEKAQLELRMEPVVAEALAWADKNEQLEEQMLQETQKWVAERTFLEARLEGEDREVQLLEQEVTILKEQVSELQAEKESLQGRLREVEEEKASLSVQALASLDQEALNTQKRAQERSALEALLAEKNKELLTAEHKLGELSEQLENLEGRIKEGERDWYTERASLESQLEAKNRELLDSDDRVVTLQHRILQLEVLGQSAEEWEKERASLEAQLQEKNKELEEAAERAACVEKDKGRLEWERAASDAQFKAMIAALEDERDSLASAVPSIDTQRTVLEGQLEEKSKEVSALQHKVESLEEMLKELQGERDAAAVELKAAMVELQTVRAEGERKRLEAEGEGEGEGSRNKGCEDKTEGAEGAQLQMEVEEKRREMAALEERVASLSQQVCQLVEEKAAAEAQVEVATAAIRQEMTGIEAELREKISAWEREKTEWLECEKVIEERMAHETQKWETERASLEAEIEGKNREILELGQKVVDFEHLVMQVQQERGEFEARVSKQSAALEAELEEKNRELGEAQQKLGEAEHKLQDLTLMITLMESNQAERGGLGDEVRGESEGEREKTREGSGGASCPQSWAAEKAFYERQLEAKNREIEELDKRVISLKQHIFQLQEEKSTLSEETAYMLSKFKAGVEAFDSERSAWEEERWALRFLRMSAEEVRSEHEGVARANKWAEELQRELDHCKRDREHLSEEVQLLQEMMREKAQAYQVERDTWEHHMASLEARLGRKTPEPTPLADSLQSRSPWGIPVSPEKERELRRALMLQELKEDERSSPSKSESSGDDSLEEVGVRLMSTDSGRSYASQEEVSLVVDLHRQLVELQAKYVKLQESKSTPENAGALGL